MSLKHSWTLQTFSPLTSTWVNLHIHEIWVNKKEESGPILAEALTERGKSERGKINKGSYKTIIRRCGARLEERLARATNDNREDRR